MVFTFYISGYFSISFSFFEEKKNYNPSKKAPKKS